MEKLETIVEKLDEFRGIAKDIIFNACHGALLAKGFVVDEMQVYNEQRGTYNNTQKRQSL